MPLRFNHMELTLPIGTLDPGGAREEISKFYGEIFGFRSTDVFIVKQNCLLLATDDETSQFILLSQSKTPLQSPGYDHLGFLCKDWDEVDALREKCEKWQAQDDRVQLKYYDDLDAGPNAQVRAFYVKYILPIWFDVQAFKYADESAIPKVQWRYQ